MKKNPNLVVFGNIESKKLIIILKFTQRQNSKKKEEKSLKNKNTPPALLPLSHLLLFQKGGVAQLIWMPRSLLFSPCKISEASSNNMQIELYSLNDKSRKKKKNKPELLLIRNVPQLHVYECLNKREKKLTSKSRFFFQYHKRAQ